MQVRTLASPNAPHPAPAEVIDKTAKLSVTLGGVSATLAWPAMKRLLDRKGSNYAS